MNLITLYKQIKQILIENPEYKDLTVVYSSDEEGNYYEKVQFLPTLGKYNEHDFIITEDKNEINSICIN